MRSGEKISAIGIWANRLVFVSDEHPQAIQDEKEEQDR